MSEYGFLESKGRQGPTAAHPGGHVRGAAVPFARIHAALASRLLSDQGVLRQGKSHNYYYY